MNKIKISMKPKSYTFITVIDFFQLITKCVQQFGFFFIWLVTMHVGAAHYFEYFVKGKYVYLGSMLRQLLCKANLYYFILQMTQIMIQSLLVLIQFIYLLNFLQ